MQDGICARLLLTMPEFKRIRWTEADVSPMTVAALTDTFDRLLSLDPAADEQGKPTPFPMPLTPAAKHVWVDYYDRHRAEMEGLDEDTTAAWSKLEAYAARLALIVQLCAWAEGNASDSAVDEQRDRKSVV